MEHLPNEGPCAEHSSCVLSVTPKGAPVTPIVQMKTSSSWVTVQDQVFLNVVAEADKLSGTSWFAKWLLPLLLGTCKAGGTNLFFLIKNRCSEILPG